MSNQNGTPETLLEVRGLEMHFPISRGIVSVSYTHLTLPTILLV